jgi:hypothetical protein
LFFCFGLDLRQNMSEWCVNTELDATNASNL